MKWQNLKKNKCPNCGNYLAEPPEGILKTNYYCPPCGFNISKTKFDEIVNSLYKPKRKVEIEDNQQGLNEL